MIAKGALLAGLALVFATTAACGLKVNEAESERLSTEEECVEAGDIMDPDTGQNCDMEHAEGLEADD